MSKTFKFGDGHSAKGSRWDVRRNGRQSIWTREDLYYAVQAFCKTHTPQEAVEIFYQCARVKRPEDVPTYAFGAVIGMLARLLSDRLFEFEIEHRSVLKLPAKKDDT